MNPTDYLNPSTKRFDADLGDWLDPDEVVVSEASCSLPNRRANPSRSADVASITRTVDQALNKYGIASGKVPVAFTPGGSRRAGFCAYNRRTGETRIRINRTAYEAFSADERLNTVLHEAAHAIQFVLYGYSDHGPQWIAIARHVGCSGDRCLSVEASQVMHEAVAKKKGLPPPPKPTGATFEMFRVGDEVSFPTRSGKIVTGKISKKSPTKADVPSSTGIYKVPYNYMTRLSKGALPTPERYAPPPIPPPQPDRYFQTAVLANGRHYSSNTSIPTFDEARATLSDFVTGTEAITGQRVVEAAIVVSERGNPVLKTVKTFKRKT